MNNLKNELWKIWGLIEEPNSCIEKKINETIDLIEEKRNELIEGDYDDE